MNSMWGAWPQLAGYSALRNLVGMFLGQAPVSQLQPEQLPPSLHPSHLTGNWGPSSKSQHGGGGGATFSKVLPNCEM